MSGGGDFVTRHRRDPLELQLTAMIDIFSMIVIFLIMGTVFGTTDMILPANMVLPLSFSAESLEIAPQLVIEKDKMRFAPLSKELSLNLFGSENANHPEIKKLENDLKVYVEQLPASAKASGVLLNLLTDELTPYKNIFDVIRVFRAAGIETVLFVTTPKGGGAPK